MLEIQSRNAARESVLPMPCPSWPTCVPAGADGTGAKSSRECEDREWAHAARAGEAREPWRERFRMPRGQSHWMRSPLL